MLRRDLETSKIVSAVEAYLMGEPHPLDKKEDELYESEYCLSSEVPKPVPGFKQRLLHRIREAVADTEESLAKPKLTSQAKIQGKRN